MPADRTSGPVTDDMAEVSQYSTAMDPLQWSDDYAALRGYDSQWSYPAAAPERGLGGHQNPETVTHGSQWQAHGSMSDFGNLHFHPSPQPLPFANPGEMHPYARTPAGQTAMSDSGMPSYMGQQFSESPEASRQVNYPSATTSNRSSVDAFQQISSESGQMRPRQSAVQGRQSPSHPATLRVPSQSQSTASASRANSVTSPMPLQEEDRLLLHLKEEKVLSWKEIAQRFQAELGVSYQIPALQMRYKRLRERMRVWSDSDIAALRQARDYWEAKKWDIISNKMVELGASEKFSAEACKRKLHELDNLGASSSAEAAASANASPPARLSTQYGQQWLNPQW